MKKIRRGYRWQSSLGMIVIGILIIGLVGQLIPLQAAVTYPNPSPYKYVNDYASVIDQNSNEQIILLGRELEQKTGAQAVVVTIDTLDGYPIEEYANGLFRKWGIGNSQEDNGLLILLVVNDKQWRVEVGRGLEGAIPDALSHRIMEALAQEAFSQGVYGVGLAQAYSEFCDQIATEYGVALTHSLQTSYNLNTAKVMTRSRGRLAYIIIIIIVFFDLLFNRGRPFRLLFWSSFFGGGGRGGGYGGGGYGGYGGGSSNGGGSSGSW